MCSRSPPRTRRHIRPIRQPPVLAHDIEAEPRQRRARCASRIDVSVFEIRRTSPTRDSPQRRRFLQESRAFQAAVGSRGQTVISLMRATELADDVRIAVIARRARVATVKSNRVVDAVPIEIVLRSIETLDIG